MDGWPRLLNSLHHQHRGCPILSRSLRKGGNHGRIRHGAEPRHVSAVSVLASGSKSVCESAALEYPLLMGKWLEIAQKMAQAARAGLAIERKRLNEILAERQKQVSSSSQSSR
jgi:hypothetical protein